jgi:hypothetical protein
MLAARSSPAGAASTTAAALDEALHEAARQSERAARLERLLAERDAQLALANEALRAAQRDGEATGAGAGLRSRGGDAATDGAAAAAAATSELASARAELEARTAELVRLKAVLRGKLLRRVLEDTDAAARSIATLSTGDKNAT